MAAVWNRAGHYIFVLLFLLSIFYLLFSLSYSQPLHIGCLPNFRTWCGLSANLGCRSETCRTRLAGNTGRKKSSSVHHHTTLSGCIFTTKACIDNWKKTCWTAISPHMSSQYGELGPLVAEICWQVWGTLANFNEFRILASLLHGTLVEGISQTLRHWAEGATYIHQRGHHVGHWPTL